MVISEKILSSSKKIKLNDSFISVLALVLLAAGYWLSEYRFSDSSQAVDRELVGQITSSQNDVRVRHSGSIRWDYLDKNLYNFTSVYNGLSSSVELTIGEYKILIEDEDTLFYVTKDKDDLNLNLLKGSIRVLEAPKKKSKKKKRTKRSVKKARKIFVKSRKQVIGNIKTLKNKKVNVISRTTKPKKFNIEEINRRSKRIKKETNLIVQNLEQVQQMQNIAPEKKISFYSNSSYRKEFEITPTDYENDVQFKPKKPGKYYYLVKDDDGVLEKGSLIIPEKVVKFPELTSKPLKLQTSSPSHRETIFNSTTEVTVSFRLDVKQKFDDDFEVSIFKNNDELVFQETIKPDVEKLIVLPEYGEYKYQISAKKKKRKSKKLKFSLVEKMDQSPKLQNISRPGKEAVKSPQQVPTAQNPAAEVTNSAGQQPLKATEAGKTKKASKVKAPKKKKPKLNKQIKTYYFVK